MSEMQRRMVGDEFELSEESDRKIVRALFVNSNLILSLDEMGDLWLITYDHEENIQTEIYLGPDGRLILHDFEITAKLLLRGDA